MMNTFDIPVVLFLFKRKKAVKIIEQLRKVRPQRLYLLADQGRDDDERKQVESCRRVVEEAIDWECQVIKNYAEENRGVYGNIALGAKWVFEREEVAIFLEDDNLPEFTFFQYCKELLLKYKDDEKILWICGTNYLGEYRNDANASYMFTRHMLPCGWASWKDKFLKYYDESLSGLDCKALLKNARKNSFSWYLYRQYKRSWDFERKRILAGKRPVSWDYQMDFAIKSNGLYGISPIKNQIKNIGVDNDSIHGGNSLMDIMTRRFCEIETYELEFPLIHPDCVSIDEKYEKEIAKIVQYPLRVRIQNLKSKLKRLFLKGKRNINENCKKK